MTAEPLILALDDEPGILRLLKLELSAQGFRVLTTSTPAEALRLAEEQRPDMILLDILMPELNGLEVMRSIRERGNTPVILLTAKDQDADKVRGLESGADDYVVKPFSSEELAARITAVLRRSSEGSSVGQVVHAGDVEVDLNRRIVTRGAETVNLTRTEWVLLQHLAANAGKVLLNTELLTKVWGPEYRDDLQYLRVWVSRLRRKLERDPSTPQIIKTRPGIGYIFETDTPATGNGNVK
jgi:two-component system KDP operon response regulator KdpE